VHNDLTSVKDVSKMCVQFVVTAVTVSEETSRMNYFSTAPRNLRSSFVWRRKCPVCGYCQDSKNPPVQTVTKSRL